MQSHSHIGANVYTGNLSTPTPPPSLSATRLKAQEIDVGEKAVVAHTCLSGVVGSGKVVVVEKPGAYYYMSRNVRKLVFGVSDQVRHKSACTVTEAD